MVSARARPLGAVDLMKLYGKIHFTWNLRTDHLTWNGPINKLFGSDYPLSTGSSFLTRLTTVNFWKRFKEIDNREGDTYTASYAMTLPSQLDCHIIETATLIQNSKGLPERLEGSIQVCEGDLTDTTKDFSGYDTLTGLPSREVLLETLSCVVEQTQGEIAPGGYLVFCLDKLSLIYFLHGFKALQESLLKVGTNLKRFTRFNDTVGRISGCCFGSVLKDTDEWGVFQAANRLAESCTAIKIETGTEMFSPTVSVGGSAFREGVSPIDIINQAEQVLFDMQHIKGTGINIENADIKPIDVARPQTTKAGERRLADIKSETKKTLSQKTG